MLRTFGMDEALSPMVLASVDRATAKTYPASGLALNGDGIHTVSCTAWNKAVDPQGQPNTGSSSTSAPS